MDYFKSGKRGHCHASAQYHQLETQGYPQQWESFTPKSLAKVPKPNTYSGYQPIALGYHLFKVSGQVISTNRRHRSS